MRTSAGIVFCLLVSSILSACWHSPAAVPLFALTGVILLYEFGWMPIVYMANDDKQRAEKRRAELDLDNHMKLLHYYGLLPKTLLLLPRSLWVNYLDAIGEVRSLPLSDFMKLLNISSRYGLHIPKTVVFTKAGDSLLHCSSIYWTMGSSNRTLVDRNGYKVTIDELFTQERHILKAMLEIMETCQSVEKYAQEYQRKNMMPKNTSLSAFKQTHLPTNSMLAMS
jgi:hypothetical protein